MSQLTTNTSDLQTVLTAVNALPDKITVEPLSVTENGTYTAPSGKAYTPVIVAGSGGITPSGNIELTQQSGTDVTNYATASVRSASTTVSAAKSVSNHTATVTPSVAVGTSGWIGNGASGTPVTVSAADLGAVVPSGTKQITANGTGIDVANYAAVDVSVPSKPEQTKSASYTSNGTYDITPDSGYAMSKATVTVAIPYYEGW